MKIVPDQFMNLFERYDLESEVVNSTCYLDGQLYVGTDRGLIVVNQEKVVDRIPLKRAVTASGEDKLVKAWLINVPGGVFSVVLCCSFDHLSLDVSCLEAMLQTRTLSMEN